MDALECGGSTPLSRGRGQLTSAGASPTPAVGRSILVKRPLDTSEEADRIQFEIFGRMSVDQKLRQMCESIDAARASFEASIRKRHLDYTEKDARLARIRWELGDELFREVYPNEPLRDP
jgi:hypothetical protein